MTSSITLPQEILWRIFAFSGPDSIRTASYVCKEWSYPLNSDQFWKYMAVHHFGMSKTFDLKKVENLTCKNHKDWRQVYCTAFCWNKQKNPDVFNPQIFTILQKRLKLSSELGFPTQTYQDDDLNNAIADITTIIKSNISLPLHQLLFETDKQHMLKIHTFKILVAAGFNIYETTPQINGNLLHLAAQKGFLDVIMLLFRHGLNSINDQDTLGNTPLYYASKYDKEHLVKWLIQNGAEVNKRNQSKTLGIAQTAEMQSLPPQYGDEFLATLTEWIFGRYLMFFMC